MFIGGPNLNKIQNTKIPRALHNLLRQAKDEITAYRSYPELQENSVIGDFQRLPIINASDLHKDPKRFRSSLPCFYRISSSSGTSGTIKTLYRSYRDHVISSKIASNMFRISGIGKGDVVGILQPFDIWGIAFIAIDALRYLNATGLAIGSALDDDLTIEYLRKFCPDVLYMTPSRANSLMESVKEKNLEKGLIVKRAILLAGEPMAGGLRKKAKDILGCDIYSIYGSEETDGLASECCSHSGIHLVNENVLFELIDASTKAPTHSNEGFLVVTPLQKNGTVLIRYLLGDIVKLNFNKCKCGRDTPRIVNISRSGEGFFLWDALYVPLEHIEKSIFKEIKSRVRYQCILMNIRPPQMLHFLIDYQINDIDVQSLKNRIIAELLQYNVCLQKAYREKDLGIKISFNAGDKFITNERGKMQKMILLK